jgi:hypothetical protein
MKRFRLSIFNAFAPNHCSSKLKVTQSWQKSEINPHSATARRPSDSLQGLIRNAGQERVIGDELIDRDMTVFFFSFYARV